MSGSYLDGADRIDGLMEAARTGSPDDPDARSVLLSADEVATAVCMSLAWVERQLKAERLPGVNRGTPSAPEYYVPLSSLPAWSRKAREGEVERRS